MQQAHQLIYRQNQRAKHQMAHHLDVSLDSNRVAAELILESRIHPFSHGALAVANHLGRIEDDLLATARIVVDQRGVSQVFNRLLKHSPTAFGFCRLT